MLKQVEANIILVIFFFGVFDTTVAEIDLEAYQSGVVDWTIVGHESVRLNKYIVNFYLKKSIVNF